MGKLSGPYFGWWFFGLAWNSNLRITTSLMREGGKELRFYGIVLGRDTAIGILVRRKMVTRESLAASEAPVIPVEGNDQECERP